MFFTTMSRPVGFNALKTRIGRQTERNSIGVSHRTRSSACHVEVGQMRRCRGRQETRSIIDCDLYSMPPDGHVT